MMDEDEELEALRIELEERRREEKKAKELQREESRKHAQHLPSAPIRPATQYDDEGELSEQQEQELQVHLKEIQFLKSGGSGRKSPLRASQMVHEDQQKKLGDMLKLKEDLLMGRASPQPTSPSSEPSSPHSGSPGPRYGSRKEQLAEVRKRTEETLNNPDLLAAHEERGRGGGGGFFQQEVIRKQTEEIETLKRFIESKGLSMDSQSQADAEKRKQQQQQLEELRRTLEFKKREQELEIAKKKAAEKAEKAKAASSQPASASKRYQEDDEMEEMQKRLADAKNRKAELVNPSISTQGASVALNEKEREFRALTERLKGAGTQAENEARLAAAKAKQEKSMYGVDVCFIMDCTGSMTDWIDITRNKIVDLAREVPNIKASRKPHLRIGFVGYRDVEYPLDQQFIKVDFFDIEDQAAMKKFQDTLKAIVPLGGSDFPEDVTGGMNYALKEMVWESSTKLIIHFGDAPCHGRKYHDIEQEDHPDGCPRGFVPENILNEYASHSISYYFGEILEDTTRMMTDIFKAHMAKIQKSELFKVLPMNSGTDMFLPEVVQSIAQSMRQSQLFGM